MRCYPFLCRSAKMETENALKKTTEYFLFSQTSFFI